MGDGIDDDGWETVSEHTVNSGEEEEEQEEKEQKQKQEAGQRKKNMQEAAAASPASEADAGGSSVKSKSEPSAAAAAAAAAGGGGQPQGIVPEAEDLIAFVAEQVSKNADAGLKTVAAAIKDAHPQWAVGEVRLKKMLSEVKTGGKKKEGPVEVQPLSLDADGRIAGIEGMDFAFRSFHDAFDFSDPEAMAKLVADCRVRLDPLPYPHPPSLFLLLSPSHHLPPPYSSRLPAFLLPHHPHFSPLDLGNLQVACRCQSFWLAAGAKPRFALERMARTIFDLHTAGLSTPYDAKTSGAEWWVHFRGPQVEDGEAIGFHWDRDETYADVTKQNVHPHVATVTYLSDHGAPTMILEQLPIAKGTCSIPKAYLSHPKLGKHVSFDGRMLHGVPPELMAPHVEKRKYTRIKVCRR